MIKLKHNGINKRGELMKFVNAKESERNENHESKQTGMHAKGFVSRTHCV